MPTINNLNLLYMDERTTAFFRFVDLRVYSKALDYSKWVITMLQMPRNEGERHLFDAFFNSANDIALNIAEGSSRNNTQFEHYLKASKSAIRQCLSYSELCYILEVFNQEQREHSHEMLMELMRMIGALIVSLGRSNRRRSEDRADHPRYPRNSGDDSERYDHDEDYRSEANDETGTDDGVQDAKPNAAPYIVDTNFENEFNGI